VPVFYVVIRTLCGETLVRANVVLIDRVESVLLKRDQTEQRAGNIKRAVGTEYVFRRCDDCSCTKRSEFVEKTRVHVLWARRTMFRTVAAGMAKNVYLKIGDQPRVARTEILEFDFESRFGALL